MRTGVDGVQDQRFDNVVGATSNGGVNTLCTDGAAPCDEPSEARSTAKKGDNEGSRQDGVGEQVASETPGGHNSLLSKLRRETREAA